MQLSICYVSSLDRLAACELEFFCVLGSTDINLVVLGGAVYALCG
jgi:Na+/H+ antiporter NhaC